VPWTPFCIACQEEMDRKTQEIEPDERMAA
jgi:hypothetical protein